MSKINFGVIPQFGEKPDKFKAHQWRERWESLTWEQLLKLSISDLVEARFRIVIEFELWGEVCRITTHYEDCKTIQRKYPNTVTIHLGQIVNLCKSQVSDASLFNILLIAGKLEAEIK